MLLVILKKVTWYVILFKDFVSRCTEFYRVFPASRVSLSTFFFVLLLSIILNELVSVGLTQKVTRYVISLGLIEPLYRVLPSFCSFDPLVLWLSIILYDLVWFWVSFENNYTLNLIKIHWYVSGFFLRDRSFIGIELNFEPLPSYPYQSLRKSWSVLSSSFGCILNCISLIVESFKMDDIERNRVFFSFTEFHWFYRVDGVKASSGESIFDMSLAFIRWDSNELYLAHVLFMGRGPFLCLFFLIPETVVGKKRKFVSLKKSWRRLRNGGPSCGYQRETNEEAN